MKQLGAERRLAFSKVPVRDGGISVLRVPDLKTYLMRVHERNGWKAESFDLQKMENFRFDGRMFREYAKKVLERDIRSVHFPLAYNGAVAKAISDAGIEVLASDLSGHWVEHCRGIGLEAQKLSFEQMPGGKFHAVVTFEPYPITDQPEGYLGMLNIFSQGIPFMMIWKSSWWGKAPPNLEVEVPKTFAFEPVKSIDGKSGRDAHYPTKENELERIAYDYGAAYSRHYGYGPDFYSFEFMALVPDENVARNARIDAGLL